MNINVSPAALKAASELLRDAAGNVDPPLATKVAALIDAEREACARVALEVGPIATDPDGPWYDIAAAIRARGKP